MHDQRDCLKLKSDHLLPCLKYFTNFLIWPLPISTSHISYHSLLLTSLHLSPTPLLSGEATIPGTHGRLLVLTAPSSHLLRLLALTPSDPHLSACLGCPWFSTDTDHSAAFSGCLSYGFPQASYTPHITL